MYKIPVILGPTGSGKSRLAYDIALELGNIEIISCDSRQIYKNMDIGTAKPSKKELVTVPHHLINIIEPIEEFSAGRWVKECNIAIEKIQSRGNIPLVVGGTLFYFDALINGLSKSSDQNIELRNLLLEKEKLNKGSLYKELLQKNQEVASKIHPNDTYRIVRAILNFDLGETLMPNISNDNYKIFSLSRDRAELYNLINHRVDKMVGNGLFKEFTYLVEELGYSENTPGMKSVGYREFFDYIKGDISLDDAFLKVKQNSRKYAKKQLTWLRNKMKGTINIECTDNKYLEIKGKIQSSILQ